MKNYFIEEDFIELRDSVKNLIDVIEKYKNMGIISFPYFYLYYFILLAFS